MGDFILKLINNFSNKTDNEREEYIKSIISNKGNFLSIKMLEEIETQEKIEFIEKESIIIYINFFIKNNSNIFDIINQYLSKFNITTEKNNKIIKDFDLIAKIMKFCEKLNKEELEKLSNKSIKDINIILEEFTRRLKIFNYLSKEYPKILMSVNDENSLLSCKLEEIKNLLLNLNSEDLKLYIASSAQFKTTIKSFYSSKKNQSLEDIQQTKGFEDKLRTNYIDFIKYINPFIESKEIEKLSLNTLELITKLIKIIHNSTTTPNGEVININIFNDNFKKLYFLECLNNNGIIDLKKIDFDLIIKILDKNFIINENFNLNEFNEEIKKIDNIEDKKTFVNQFI